ncbi:hypothetical protein [Scytonema sp. PRP1]|uniref:hypothetical protein n=1 Tax=Scytonema sp. PRP1 TaxID=3120513 RepID=UPI002FD0F426
MGIIYLREDNLEIANCAAQHHFMAESQLQQSLPNSEQLPCSDDTPVDNVDRRAWRSQDLDGLMQNISGLNDWQLCCVNWDKIHRSK